MKKLLLIGLALFAVACVANILLAADEPAKVTVTGTVVVNKNDDGGITVVCVKAGDAMTKLVLDDNGKKVAEMAGKKVDVTGTWQGEGDAKMLKVETCKASEEKKE